METKLHTLANGLRVITVDTKSFPTVTALVLVGAGSRYEQPENNGIAHFLEHMFYKGSKEYPNPEIISQIIEGMGGHWNAFTSKDYTGYYIKASTAHFTSMIDMLSDLLLHSLFDEKEIEREKGVIVEEINMYEDTPQRRVSELFENSLFAGNPLGYDILGTPKTVTSFTRKTFTGYMDRLYKPNNAVIVLAGGLGSGNNYVKYIEEKFGKWKKGTFDSFNEFSPSQKSSNIQVHTKKTEQTHFCIGYPTFGQNDKRRPALKVLATILGGGSSSRLFQEVREKRGLCYYIGTGIDQYKEIGHLMTQAGVAKDLKKVKAAIHATLHEHVQIARGNVNEGDIARSKEMLKGRLLLSMEDSFNVAHYYGLKQLHEGKIISPNKLIQEVQSVTKMELVKLAQDLFIADKLTCAIIGPFSSSDFAVTDLTV